MACGGSDSNVGKKINFIVKEQQKPNKSESEIISMLMNYNLMTTIDSRVSDEMTLVVHTSFMDKLNIERKS